MRYDPTVVGMLQEPWNYPDPDHDEPWQDQEDYDAHQADLSRDDPDEQQFLSVARMSEEEYEAYCAECEEDFNRDHPEDCFEDYDPRRER